MRHEAIAIGSALLFGLTPEEIQFQQEVDKYLNKAVTEGVRGEWRSGLGYGQHCWDLLRKLGEKRWLACDWPERYGGLGFPFIKAYIVLERLDYHRAPRLTQAVNMVGPVILKFGTDEQKQAFLPKISSGQIEVAVGFTEALSGSDLASIRMTAVKQGDSYVLNGCKTFSTRCHFAKYHWVLARTDASLPKHKGLSLFIIDLGSPGIDIRPIWCMDGTRTNRVVYQDVRVPAGNLIGEENKGWIEVGMVLDRERVNVGATGLSRYLFEELTKYVKETCPGDASVRQKLADCAVELEAASLFVEEAVHMLNNGDSPAYECALAKLFTTESRARLINIGLEVLGLYGQLMPGSKWAKLGGLFEWEHRNMIMWTVGGGPSEILRNAIAIRGLGQPRD